MRAWTLPDGFTWHLRDAFMGRGAGLALKVGGPWGVEVALVKPRADGVTWLADVNRHRDWRQRPHGVHATERGALRMVERWAEAHAARLLQETGAITAALERSDPHRRPLEGPVTGVQSVAGRGAAGA